MRIKLSFMSLQFDLQVTIAVFIYRLRLMLSPYSNQSWLLMNKLSWPLGGNHYSGSSVNFTKLIGFSYLGLKYAYVKNHRLIQKC